MLLLNDVKRNKVFLTTKTITKLGITPFKMNLAVLIYKLSDAGEEVKS
jgi:hypothetical protein